MNTFRAEQESTISIVGAGDPIWASLEPDDYKAYVRLNICSSLPLIHGPEMHGRYFGFHPQVLANSHRSILHQQTNLGHRLAAYRAPRDRIVGCVVGVAFPERSTPWDIPENPADAPSMEIVAVVHKAAEGVATWLGNHQSGRQKSSVSIETQPALDQIHVFDPLDRSIHTLAEADEKFPNMVHRHKENGLLLRAFDGRQMGFALGGADGVIDFQGFGYVPVGAEKTAKIQDIRAGREGESMMIAALSLPDWEAGEEVTWRSITAQDAGRGVIKEVIYQGTHKRHGMTMKADPAHPLLDIQVAGKPYSVLRTTAFVTKKRSV